MITEEYKKIKDKIHRLEGCRRCIPEDLPPTPEQEQREVQLTQEILVLEEQARNAQKHPSKG